ncbi:hypothetical protein [Legionella tunisiensis]|nr:hypothetical protein [Legionella tunisiensis]
MIWPCPPGFYCLVAQKLQEAQPDVLLETASEDELLLTNRVPLQPI